MSIIVIVDRKLLVFIETWNVGTSYISDRYIKYPRINTLAISTTKR